MDKAEYRIKLEQINALAEEGDFRGAAEIADEIDWRHVKSARTLCMIGEIYEANKRYEDSCRILKYAYKRSSSSKTVLYRLAELDIRIGNYDEAKKFINEFESNSPGDTSRYILKYKLLRATKAPLDDQIEVLKEYKDNEYTERWSYELAKLYKKNGQKEKCIEECDDMILWFSEGRYVMKAMELKMSITSLTPMQQAKYESELHKVPEEAAKEPSAEEEPALSGIENVEKKILAAEEDEDDVHTEVSAEEAISRMDTAAGRFSGNEIDTHRNEDSKQKDAGNEFARLQDKVTSGIRNIFSGMRLEKDEAEVEEEALQAEAAAAEEAEHAAQEEPVSEEEALADVFAFAKQSVEEQKKAEEQGLSENAADASPASSEEHMETGEEAIKQAALNSAGEAGQSADLTADAPEAAGEPVSDEAVSGGETIFVPEGSRTEAAPSGDETVYVDGLPMKNGEVDFEKLFAQTGSALADEVASGNYVMADTLEEDRADAEEAAELSRREAEETPERAEEESALTDEELEAKKQEEDLIGRETDESLGLTREFSFREELRKAQETAEEKEPLPIESPEEAARRAVLAENGRLGEEIPEIPEEDTPYSASESGEEAARGGEVPASQDTGADEKPDEEMLAAFSGEEDIDVPEEEHETLLGLSGLAQEEEETAAQEEITDVDGSSSGVFTIISREGRELTGPEKSALSYFAAIPGIDRQTTAALADIHNNSGDKTSRSGNIVIMGRQGSGKTRLADGLILMTCLHLGLKAVKVGRIVADDFNKKDPAAVVKKLSGGFLLIEGAGALSDEAIDRLNRAMEFRTDDLVVILEDEREDVKKVLADHPEFAEKFTSQITVPVFTNDELAAFARIYAAEEGYKFDDLSMLALYSTIGSNQKEGEPVTVGRVREIVDRAIDRNHRKLFGRVTDKEDGRVVLQEKDFHF